MPVFKKIHLTFTLDRHVGFPPARVAAAVDLNENDHADPGESVVWSCEDLEWTATFGSRKPLNGLYVVVDYFANIGAKYEVTIRKTNEKGAVVAAAKDRVRSAPDLIWLKLKAS